MKTERIAAHGLAALVSLLLLILPPAILANEIHDARLAGIESLHSGPYPNRISVRIGNRIEHLLVAPNADFNNLLIIDANGTPQLQFGTAYAGIIESLPNSWARVVIDGDYIAGTIHSGNVSTNFTSESRMANPSVGFATHDVVLLPPAQTSNETTGQRSIRSITADTAGKNSTYSEQADEVSVPVNSALTGTVGDVTRVARIGVVVDALYQEAIGGRGLSKALSTINSVDGLYREKFGLALKLDVVVLVTDDTTLTLDGATLEDNLELFRDYRISTDLLPDDLGLVHLFTGVESEDDAIGLAYKGAACRTDGYDVSMSRPFRYPVLLTAHEIGHNLGADHDDATTECRDIEDHLMFSAINSSTTREFSSCSNNSINARMQQSTCLAAAIDIELTITQLESNQVLARITNLDATRAFPAATLYVDLKNATIAEAPALCELADPSKLTCDIPATYAGDTQELAVKLRLTPNLERTVTMRLDPTGFFDLHNQNNLAELVIPGEPQPLAVTGGELTTQGAGASGGGSAGGNTPGGDGGGSNGLPLISLLLFTWLIQLRQQRKAYTSSTKRSNCL